MEIIMHKQTLVATELIKNTICYLNLEDLLEDSTKRFLNMSFNTKNLSLTHNQDDKYQLRFYNQSFALEAINKVAILIATKIDEKVNFKLHVKELSYIEKFFFDRLSILTKNRISYQQHFTILNISVPLIYTYEKMRYFQNIGDNWTAAYIGEFLIGNLDQQNNLAMFLKNYSFNFMELGNPLASKVILEEVIHRTKINHSKKDNEALIGCYYALGLLYIRNLPVAFRDKEKAKNMFKSAQRLLENPEFMYDTNHKIFSWVFNRNGYALTLFYENKYQETINLMNKLVAKLEPVIQITPVAKLHLSVLHYNLFQVYNAIGDNINAENELKIVIDMDPNDREYKYDYIRFLFKINNLTKAKDLLDDMYDNNMYDPVYHASYYGQYYIGIKNFERAASYCYQAICYNFNSKQTNYFIYNYLVSLVNGKNLNQKTLKQLNSLVESHAPMEKEVCSLIQKLLE